MAETILSQSGAMIASSVRAEEKRSSKSPSWGSIVVPECATIQYHSAYTTKQYHGQRRDIDKP